MNYVSTRKKAVSLLLILAMLTVMIAALLPVVSTADGDEIQDFGYQAPKDYSMIDATSNLRFVFTIGRIDYTEVGFVFSKTDSTPSIEEGCATSPATTVYRSITADGKTVDADDGRYWVAVKLNNIPRSYFDGDIYVRAYVTDGEGTRYSSNTATISVWKAHPAIEYHSNWDYATRSENANSIQNPDYKDNNDYLTFGIKDDVKKLFSDKTPVRYFPNENNNYAGNDLLVEFSFLYNDTMSNASDGTLTVMYIENNNVFDINLKTGMISNASRPGDVVLYQSPDLEIHGYGWHRFGVRIHQNAINNNGVEDYQIIATAYLDGERILEVDKTAYAKSKTGSYTGKLYELIPYTNRMIYDKVSKNCDAYVMIEKIYKSSANAGYLILQDLSFSCGQTFQQQVVKVAEPASQTWTADDGVTTFTGNVYFAAAGAHEHVWDGNYTITKPATLLENGWKSEHCSICGAGHAVVSAPSETTPVVINGKDASAPTGWGSSKDFYAPRIALQDIAADEGHFYPTDKNPEGLDYLVEFSILWNSTLASATWNGDENTLDLGNFSGGSKARSTSWLVKNGTIDLSDGDGGSVLINTGKTVSGNGWHRIGLRYHQTAVNNGGSVAYTLTYTIYIDGVEAYKVIGGAARYVNENYLLYEATIENDELVYSDNTQSGRKYCWLQLQKFFGQGSDTYLVLADLMTSAGQDFMQQVEPAPSPVASPINLGSYDTQLMYYQLKSAE